MNQLLMAPMMFCDLVMPPEPYLERSEDGDFIFGCEDRYRADDPADTPYVARVTLRRDGKLKRERLEIHEIVRYPYEDNEIAVHGRYAANEGDVIEERRRDYGSSWYVVHNGGKHVIAIDDTFREQRQHIKRYLSGDWSIKGLLRSGRQEPNLYE